MCKETINKDTNTEPSVDPAFLSCFEGAMLDYEILTKRVEDKGMRLKHDKEYRKMLREGHWKAQWIMDNYTLVCCKMSKLSRSMRDFLEYLGDNAAAAWMQAEEEARKRTSEPSKEPNTPEG